MTLVELQNASMVTIIVYISFRFCLLLLSGLSMKAKGRSMWGGFLAGGVFGLKGLAVIVCLPKTEDKCREDALKTSQAKVLFES